MTGVASIGLFVAVFGLLMQGPFAQVQKTLVEGMSVPLLPQPHETNVISVMKYQITLAGLRFVHLHCKLLTVPVFCQIILLFFGFTIE